MSMAEGKGKKDDFLWWVQCEGHYDVPVIAPNWELATVEAAHLWGVGQGGRQVRAAGEAAGGAERVPAVRQDLPRLRPAVR